MNRFIVKRIKTPALRWVSLCLSIILLSLFFRPAGAENSREIAIIVHPGLAGEVLSLEEVRRIYLGDVEFVGRRRLKPIDQSEDQEIRRQFLHEVLHISKADYSRHWMHLIFMGGTEGPILRKDGPEVLQAVRESEGAIGYVWADEAMSAKGVQIVLRTRLKAKPLTQLNAL